MNPEHQNTIRPSGHPNCQGARLHIVVVGPCASGKSTLVEGLQARGYTGARLVPQEHSGVPTLWAWRGSPDVLVYLDAAVDTINHRQGRSDWTQAVLDEQHARLRSARQACQLYLPTDVLSIPQVLEAVVDFIERFDS